ncbi:hypothetical protein ACWD67_05930, partial [Streptomyces sp. 900116325]
MGSGADGAATHGSLASGQPPATPVIGGDRLDSAAGIRAARPAQVVAGRDCADLPGCRCSNSATAAVTPVTPDAAAAAAAAAAFSSIRAGDPVEIVHRPDHDVTVQLEFLAATTRREL